MGLHNLKDAGGLIPNWVTACLLNAAFLAMFVVAQYRYDSKPSAFVASACTMAILLSLVLGLALLIREIVLARTGEVANAVSKGMMAGLNLSWAITCLSFICFVAWKPVSSYVVSNLTIVASGAVALAIVAIGYFFAAPAKRSNGEDAKEGHSLVAVPGIKPSVPQQPAFQVTIADLTRLLTHQAGRAIGYAGSNVLFDDAFSLELDANERVARVYSNTNLVNTEDFLYWRLHMLMMGSAAEKVLTGKSSQAALDDLTSFDHLASNYLTLRPDRTFNAAPINVHEAQIKASRIAMLRKNVFDRCYAACLENRKVLADLVKMMRTRSVLTYGDIRQHLERVTMPEGFPVARFDDDEVLLKALLTHDDHPEVTLEGAAVVASDAADQDLDSTLSSFPHAQAHTTERQPADAANEEPQATCMTA
ncbi:hypothetical protein PSOLE_33330 [Pseudomonas oleovorans subsp. oleovorans]|uniref:Transmembrane protein n=1 Tax=Ectopseudomonas oleovorans TaxID=301 RepID=A0A379PKA1_ECTOL|nr:hypothetical protein [Pseudomonas oleovorans]OWK41574.1 hypothetical protein PSOLE_33330 [Pseudomonas oleovorans subsp. oleovorans]SEJ34857.1 hypothetical protein SAMN05216280_101941 [Pseudomonas oleovorans]SUE72354.1 Uncharacterised protein [Pseudomonas oleovorans]SUE72794.1 Uncharacterised protein [Pseudomonas oleovorans]